MLSRPDIADFLDEVARTAGLELLLEEVQLAPRSPLLGHTLAEAQLRSRLGIVVLAYKGPDGHMTTSPEAGSVLESGARIVALGTRDQLHELA